MQLSCSGGMSAGCTVGLVVIVMGIGNNFYSTYWYWFCQYF